MENATLPGYSGARGLNFWEADAALHAAAGSRLTPQARARSPEFGAFAGRTLDALIDVAHNAANLPKLVDGALRYGSYRMGTLSSSPNMSSREPRLRIAAYSGQSARSFAKSFPDGSCAACSWITRKSYTRP